MEPTGSSGRGELTPVLSSWLDHPTSTLSSLLTDGKCPRVQIKHILEYGDKVSPAKVVLSDGQHWVTAIMDQRWTMEIQKNHLKELDIIDLIQTTGGMSDLVIVCICAVKKIFHKISSNLRGGFSEGRIFKLFQGRWSLMVPSCLWCQGVVLFSQVIFHRIAFLVFFFSNFWFHFGKI